MEKVTRAEAIERKLPRYYSGNECRNGHICERITSSRKCVMCNREYQSRLFHSNQAHKEKVLARLAKANKSTQKNGWAKLSANPEKKNEYRREGYKRNPMNQIMRSMVRRTLLGKHSNRTAILLGYGGEELKSSITEKLHSGMTWDNYGEWHIDHIKPISAFLADGETDPAVVNSLDNLQPMWASENLKKGSEWDGFRVKTKK